MGVEGLRIGQVIDAGRQLEIVTEFEWGVPVTVAVEAMDRVAHAPRPAGPVSNRHDRVPGDLARLVKPASQMITV